MKTQLKTEVLGICIELSVVEAKLFLKDPHKVQEEVRIMLSNNGVDIPDRPQKKTVEGIIIVACPDCGKELEVIAVDRTGHEIIPPCHACRLSNRTEKEREK